MYLGLRFLLLTSVTVWALFSSQADHLPAPRDHEPGRSYFGTNGYVEYRVGDLPIILSAPHGGGLEPEDLPDRLTGVLINDYGSQELVLDLAEELHAATGGHPHVILNHLHRSKMDPNRPVESGAQGDAVAQRAWQEYHAYIEVAQVAVEAAYGRGHYFDVHSHGKAVRQVELGYGLPGAALRLPEAELNGRGYVVQSNLRSLLTDTGQDLVDVVRGPESLGALLEDLGYFALPSPARPYPDSPDYFDGGYSVFRHGSRSGGSIDATQIEVPNEFLAGPARAAHAERWAGAILTFVEAQYGLRLRRDGACGPDVAGGCAARRPSPMKIKTRFIPQ